MVDVAWQWAGWANAQRASSGEHFEGIFGTVGRFCARKLGIPGLENRDEDKGKHRAK